MNTSHIANSIARKASIQSLNLRTVENRLKYLKPKLNMGKPTNPHAIRHGRLTDLAKQGFSEMELRLIAGWEKNSTLPEVYVHLSGGDIERRMLQKAGFVEIEQAKESSLDLVECPLCKTKNPYDAMYCLTCSMVLNQRAAMKVDESMEEAKGSQDYGLLLKRITMDLCIL